MSKKTDKKAEKKEKAPKKKQQPEEVKKPATGLRTAVRYGHMTAQEALAQLEKAKADGGYVGEEIVSWLKRRT